MSEADRAGWPKLVQAAQRPVLKIGRKGSAATLPYYRPGGSRFTIFLVPARGTTCSGALAVQGMIPTNSLRSCVARGVIPMKTLGWAAIIYNVHDALTFSAVLMLIVGECTVTYIANRKPRGR
jgi:hypothetical protein